ncbi:hypothetical protein L9F63_016671, partial [Diploptera punctata]
FVWGVAIFMASLGAVALVTGSWQRYQANPTVVSLQKNYRKWITPFPAFTMCYHENLNVTRAEKIIKKLWGKVHKVKKEYYINFLNTVVNSSLGNLHEFEKYEQDSTLDNVNIKDIASKVILVSELPGTVKFYVHSPDEMPIQGKDKPRLVSRGLDTEIIVTHRQTVASPELRQLYPVQRNCRFQDEIENTKSPIYSYNICKMECRKQMAKQYCDCVPFFYKAFATREEKMCNTKGMACLAKYKDNITNEIFTNREFCPCYQQCENMEYITENENTYEIESEYEEVTQQVRFYIRINHYTKTRLKRDVIFTYEDLVVSFGGTVSLFLGCSILSGVEFVYFFTLRLICKLWMQYRTNNNNRLQTDRILPSDLRSSSQQHDIVTIT